MKSISKTVKKGIYTLHYRLIRLGNDYCLLVTGGEEHIGSVAVGVSRPSLANQEATSSTVSLLNITGHKDDVLARPLAEALCQVGMQAVVIAGVHFDGLTTKGIEEIICLNEQVCEEISEWVSQLINMES